jgi:hypothetical protein
MNEKDDWTYKQVILQFDLDSKPQPDPQATRQQKIAASKEWFDGLTAPAEETIRRVGAYVLDRAWLTAELLIAVAEPDLEYNMEQIEKSPGVVDWYLRDELGPLRPLTE